MTALDHNRNNPLCDDSEFHDPVAADVHVYAGALVVVDTSGNARPGRTSTSDKARGIAVLECDNEGGDAGDAFVKSRARVGAFFNGSGADEVLDTTQPGTTLYVIDDQTVGLTNGSATRCIAGRFVRLEGGMVHCAVGTRDGGDGDLLASDNLGVGLTAATARANIGANKGSLTLFLDTLAGASAKRFLVQAPVALTITKIRSVLMGHALATGDATLTGKIAGTAITNGVVTITQSGSAIGDKDSATPSALNVASAGDLIELLLGGTNDDTDAQAMVTIDYTY